MKRLLALVATASLLAACGTVPGVTGVKAPSAIALSDAGAMGGLSSTLAAHPSVQLGTPAAYALSGEGGAFRAALERVVRPLRQALADRLEADATVSRGLSAWERSTSSQRLAVLKRVAAIEGEVMGCQVPSIVARTSDGTPSGVMAYYQPAAIGVGEVVVYTDAVARGGKYMAVSTLVHEIRHAAQDQLIQASQGFLSSLDSDERTLATAYAASWQAMNAVGGESSLAYGDYAHLNVEFDAFQTGNEVAAILSGGQFDATGFGFVDTHYSADGTVGLDLTALEATTSGTAFVAAVNKAEYQAEKGRTGSSIVIPVRGPRMMPRFGR